MRRFTGADSAAEANVASQQQAAAGREKNDPAHGSTAWGQVSSGSSAPGLSEPPLLQISCLQLKSLLRLSITDKQHSKCTKPRLLRNILRSSAEVGNLLMVQAKIDEAQKKIERAQKSPMCMYLIVQKRLALQRLSSRLWAYQRYLFPLTFFLVCGSGLTPPAWRTWYLKSGPCGHKALGYSTAQIAAKYLLMPCLLHF